MKRRMLWKACLLFLLVVFCERAHAFQHQSMADSLIIVFKQLPADDTSSMRILKLILENHTDSRERLKYSSKLLEASQKFKSARYLYYAYLNEGKAYTLLGDFDVATYSLFKALTIAERTKYSEGVAQANIALGDVYSILDDHDNSANYYSRAIGYLGINQQAALAMLYLKLGGEYYMAGIYDSALTHFENSKLLYESIPNQRSGLAYNLGNIGLTKAELGEFDEAKQYVQQAKSEFLELDDFSGIATFYTYMSDVYRRHGNLKMAKIYADSSLMLSKKYGLTAEVRDNSRRLADIYAMTKDYELAYKYHQQFVALKDSLSSEEVHSQMEGLESAFELAKEKGAVALLKAEKRSQDIIKNSAIIIAIILTILALVSFRFYREKARINKILEDQKTSLESLNTTKDKFFSIISHDLRGPISSFHGISAMIKYFVKSNETDQLLDVADNIDQSVNSLSNLLDNLLSWAVQQQGQLPNVPELVDLDELVGEIESTLSNMASAKGIKLEKDIEAGSIVFADKNAVRTIIRNLVNNALKFTSTGGTVSIITKGGETIDLMIKDTGVGIPQHRLEKLFQFQEKKSTYGTSGEKGLGLGLQLVSEFVSLCKAKIKVQSEEGMGTSFIVSFPKSK